MNNLWPKKMWYSWFLLLLAAVLCKLAASTELVNTEALQLGQYRIRLLPPASDPNIRINLLMHHFALCVFLFQDTLFNIYC